MRKKIVIIIILILAVPVYIFRYELLFRFQFSRLKGLGCQAEATHFIHDSCLHKLWVHRVNSNERYEKVSGKLGGCETDIVWDSKTKQFLVYHPPLEGEAILLDSFLHIANADLEMFWLDTRETKPADTLAILDEFNRLTKLYGVKMNAIIELYDTTVANYLAEHGYWVALNINTDWIQKFSRESQWEELRRSMSPMISFVSQEDTYVPLLKEKFPGKDIITWSLAFKNYFNRKHLKELLSDDKVKVVLVNIKSRYYK
jgi:hypothetical protein